MPGTTMDSNNRIQELKRLGQSVWVDLLHREMIASGEVARVVEMGVSGFTSNPTSLETGITKTDAYDEALSRYDSKDNPDRVFEELTVKDIQDAADILRLTHETTDGKDGFVSVEVRPTIAHDTEATIAEARKWVEMIERPNIMVKVPGTPEGMSAIRTLTAEGFNVNVTLLFSIDVYRAAANAYIDGLRDYVSAGKGTPEGINSVASFFVSRVDVLADELIDRKVKETNALQVQDLEGTIGIANAQLAYEEFQSIFSPKNFDTSLGARRQRPLWASTSVKNPTYHDTLYADNLIGADTVNTMPLETLEAFLDHGTVSETITRDVGAARKRVQELEAAGISMKSVTDQLLREGVQKFTDSYENLMKAIREKLSRVGAR